MQKTLGIKIGKQIRQTIKLNLNFFEDPLQQELLQNLIPALIEQKTELEITYRFQSFQ
ncbi:hypothetical protein TTHERM_000363249 (macronuclear) [Tetrahymena thermophila SB210]|uniref:Uncharacterized protein n=1 Tax=Tetrahymena thermophila (strain SB210) TaxID=312017 RepID=W7XFE7_TETTS|nr:hypothetical protein TTHERM_000363249 [Tetrahymena thermophila SB210]EWS76547.1 hypothetical protein TTHERM_000363249 [Tetrahymena thermophila SB210]|eukprot:XP_012650919.1 hypothetical protein TTHERM_000363249 [Tetrahymena thermophila SB210]